MGIASGETDRHGKLNAGALDSPTVCILLLPWPATAEELRDSDRLQSG
jgi:hypothetical protein